MKDLWSKFVEIKPPEGLDIVASILWTGLAWFGGLMGYLMRTVEAGGKPRLARALLESSSAAFVGALVTLACAAMEWNALWTGVLVGVSGWLGAHASITMLEKILYKRLGITKDKES